MGLQRTEELVGVGSRTKVEAFRPGLGDYGRRATTFPGLGFTTAWLWAGVSDDDGQRYALLRQHEVGSTFLFYGLEIAPDVWSDPGVRHANIPGVDDLYIGGIAYDEIDGEHKVTPTNPLYRGMRLRFTPDRLSWREDDWLDVTLEPLGDAMLYTCPGPPDGFGYTDQICRVTGTVDGKRVRGFGGLDRFYGEPGVVWTQSKGCQQLEELWWVWAGIGEDGRQEHGVVVTGPGEFAVGFFHRDGEEPIATDHIGYDVTWSERDGRRLPTEALIELDGRRFRYEASGNVTIPGADLFIDWLHGSVVEEGGPTLVETFSWLEFFKHLAAPSGA